MNEDRLKLGSRLLIGGIAGFVGTMAMTAAMRRLHRRLPEKERYPLTPREIIDSTADKLDVPIGGERAKDVTTLAHFLYGAAAGAVLAAMNPDTSKRGGADDVERLQQEIGRHLSSSIARQTRLSTRIGQIFIIGPRGSRHNSGSKAVPATI